MFEGDKKRTAKPAPLKKNQKPKMISDTVLVSCYVASLAIAVIAVTEALKCFGGTDTKTGAFYVILAVLGVLFSVFITVMNNRNKKLLAQNKPAKIKKNM